MFLAGDAGGTKTRLALYQNAHGRLEQICREEIPSKSAPSLATIIIDFLKDKPHRPTHGCIGIPGPVIKGFVKTPNLPWEIQDTKLANEVGIPRIKLVNDLVATTASVPHLKPENLITLHPGDMNREIVVSAVLAPGTGTGQGFITTDNGKTRSWASEGGHVDFAPTNEIEDKLLNYLRSKYKGRISVERILCGPGIANIYDFLRDTGIEKDAPELQERIKTQDAGVVISQSGLKKEFPISTKALDIFARALGAHAGNLVLTYMATGGLYLGGGIPPKLASKLQDGSVLEGYFNKGRFTSLIKSVPLYIIKDDNAALLGAASIAAGL